MLFQALASAGQSCASAVDDVIAACGDAEELPKPLATVKSLALCLRAKLAMQAGDADAAIASLQEASQLLADSAYVWHLALAASGITGDADLLAFASDRINMIDALNEHCGVGLTSSVLMSVATGVVESWEKSVGTIVKSIHRMVASPQLWCELGKRLVIQGVSARDDKLLALAHNFASTALAQSPATGQSLLLLDAQVILAVCTAVTKGAAHAKATAAKLVHACPQSAFAWKLLHCCAP